MLITQNGTIFHVFLSQKSRQIYWQYVFGTLFLHSPRYLVTFLMVLVQCSWLNSNSKFLIPNHWALLCNHWRKILKWNLQDSAYHVVGTKCMNTIEHKHSVSGQQRGGYGVVVSDCQDCLCNANAGEPSSESSSPSFLCDDFAATFPPCHLIGK